MPTLEAVPNHFEEYFINKNELGTSTYYHQLKTTIARLSEVIAYNKAPSPHSTPAQLNDNIDQLLPISKHTLSFDTVLEQALETVAKNSVAVNHPHCCAHLHCPPLVPALAAEVILTTLNQSMDSWDQAPAATVLEQQLVDWLCQRSGYHNGIADGCFTSGGTQSNLIALLLARDHAIAKDIPGYDVQHHGLPAGSQRYRIICSETAHFTITKSCAVLGLGRQAVVTIPSNANGEMCIDKLHQVLAAMKANNETPIAVVATAGTTDLGAIDAIEKIATITKSHKIWLHVDAAYGGALLLDDKPLSDNSHPLHGINFADSITVDFHKLFFQPISCGALLVKNKQHLAPLCFHADYLSRSDDEELNLVDKSISTTRRFDALKLWMSLKTIGLDTFNEMIQKLKTLTLYAAKKIDKTPQLDLLIEPNLSTVLFRSRSNNAKNSIDSDNFQKQLRRTLLYSGKAVIAETKIKERVYLKLTLLNPCTSEADIDQLIDIIINTSKTIQAKVKAA